MTQTFIHLHSHTEYSIVDSTVRITRLMESLSNANVSAVALTDRGNIFAAVKFYNAAKKSGIKPILGAEIGLFNEKDPKHPFRMVLLCQNQQGWKNLIALITKTYIEGQELGVPLLKRSELKNYSEGLLLLSGGREGDIAQAIVNNDLKQADALVKAYKKIFPNRFYLELQRTGRFNENLTINKCIELANKYQTPVVATNDVRFIHEEDFESHEARVCIQGGWTVADPKRPRLYSQQQYLKSPEEMEALFSDIPEALQNTVEISKRCNVELQLDKAFLPDFPIQEGMTIEKYFAKEAKAGLKNRIDPIPENYKKRLETELQVINKMGFAGYFLVVADFIHWAKSQDIPVGPGRGSGAGSIVAYALDITDLDPIRYELLFERFLNPERVSMPDFDIDFCMEGRDRVIEYVSDRYGRESVSQIITFGTMAAKAVIRDVGRVLGHPYGFVDAIAKSIPFEIGMTLKKALDQEETLKKRFDEEADVHNLIELAMRLEGLIRNAGKHAGGVVIAPSKLTDFTALYCESGAKQSVTQFDKDDVESVGLVKFDFLGLRTLTIIHWAVQNINAQRELKNESLLNIIDIPTDDAITFKLLKSCKTTAVFQLESRGMKDLIKRLEPDDFEEIIALVALFRPGPLQSGMVDDFIDRKHKRAAVEYLHPDLESILAPTYGVILYQEQVMKIAQHLAGYSLGKADLLRRAMGKKKPEEMEKQREIFMNGAKSRNVDEKSAKTIFDIMEKFAGYGFNKSHSAAYALVAYQTAWLKAHYPAEFMAAVLSSDMDNTDKVANFMMECHHMDLSVLLPNVNNSQYNFTVTDDKKIIYGLGAIKGVGDSAIELIVAERKENGKYDNFLTFCQRSDLRKINRRVIEALIRSGAFDCWGKTRANLYNNLIPVLKIIEQREKNRAAGQNDLFGADGNQEMTENILEVGIEEWPIEELLRSEKETLGLYFSGHPLNLYMKEFEQMSIKAIAELEITQNQPVGVAGLLVNIRTMQTKRGDRMAFVTLEDQTGRLELAIFADDYKKYQSLLIKDEILIVEGEVSVDDYTGSFRMNSNHMMTLSQAREAHAECLNISVGPQKLSEPLLKQLYQTLNMSVRGSCPICIQYSQSGTLTDIWLGPEWRVSPTDELLNSLFILFDKDSVKFRYSS